MSTLEAFTNAELVAAARRSLSDPAWNRLVGAAESETTARRNRMALDSIALRPRVLVGVTDVDPSARLLGHHLRLPVLLANIGDPDLLGPDGAGAVPPVEFPTELSAFFRETDDRASAVGDHHLAQSRA